MAFYTPLRYPGGKGKLAPFIQDIYRRNRLHDGTYVEPYAGGAGVALQLLLEGFAWNIIINDIDKRIYALWWSVLHDTEWLCRKITETPVTMEMREKQKEIHNDLEAKSLPEIGFATFFLNRTSRSGILSGGVIGGKKQTGNFKIDARYNKENLISRIRLIAKYRGRIQVYNEDALDLLHRVSSDFKSKTLVYFDPPYYDKGKLLYHNFYEHEDHKRLSDFIRHMETPCIVTYDNAQEIKNLYHGESFVEFDINYHAYTRKKKGREILFYKNLALPCSPYTSKKMQQPFI